MAKELEGKPFHLIAAHNQRDTKENVVNYIKSQGLAADTPNVTVTSFGRHPKVKGNGYVPYYMVFDQHGALAHHHMCGPYHGGDGFKMVEWVNNLLKDVPSIYLGKEPFKAVPKLAAAVGKKKNLARSVAEIEKRLAAGAEGDEAKELKRLQEAIADYHKRMVDKIETLTANDPRAVLDHIEALIKDFRRTSYDADLATRLKTQRADKQLKAAIAMQKAYGKALARWEKMKKQTPKARAKVAAKLEKLLVGNESLPFAAQVRKTIEELR